MEEKRHCIRGQQRALPIVCVYNVELSFFLFYFFICFVLTSSEGVIRPDSGDNSTIGQRQQAAGRKKKIFKRLTQRDVLFYITTNLNK